VKWWLLLLWDAVAALDLDDGKGNIDHGKIVGFFSFMVCLAVVVLGLAGKIKLIPVGHLIVLISASFGWASWRTFLKSRTVKVTDETEHTREEYPYGAPTYVFPD